MVLAVLVTEFELAGFFSLKLTFFGVELLTGCEESGAMVVWALVDCEDRRVFPSIQGGATVGAPKDGMAAWSAVRRKLREGQADFTSELGVFFSVVKVEV